MGPGPPVLGPGIQLSRIFGQSAAGADWVRRPHLSFAAAAVKARLLLREWVALSQPRTLTPLAATRASHEASR